MWLVNTADVYKTYVVDESIYNPDGFPRVLISVHEEGVPQERPFPGPLLRASKGDTVHLTIKNQLEAATSIHCHGLHMHQNPWMDGVNGITECGINPGTTFTYVFNLTQTGTYWYHSHTSTQYGDGLLGPIIVDEPVGTPDHIQLDFGYTYDHVLMMQDWMHESAKDLEAYYKGPYGSFENFKPRYPWPTVSILLNGHGTFDCLWDDCSWLSKNDSTKCEGEPQCIPIRPPFFGTCEEDAHPLDEFMCPPGKYVRIRLINGAANLPFRFWIDRHQLTIVMRDGVETQYFAVDNVTVAVGQRIDVVVQCNQDPNFNYMIYVAIAPNLLPRGANLRNISASAYLIYPNATAVIPPEVTPQTPFSNDIYFEYKQLKPNIPVTSDPAVERIVILYNVAYTNKTGFPLEEWVLNNVSFIRPTMPLLPNYIQGF